MGQAAHLRNYATLEDCEVVALAELRADTGRLVAARYGILKVYGDHHKMLAAEKLDGLVASQSFGRHFHLLPDLYGKVRRGGMKPPCDAAEAVEDLKVARQYIRLCSGRRRGDRRRRNKGVPRLTGTHRTEKSSRAPGAPVPPLTPATFSLAGFFGRQAPWIG